VSPVSVLNIVVFPDPAKPTNPTFIGCPWCLSQARSIFDFLFSIFYLLLPNIGEAKIENGHYGK
jgi:hypothetical protein